MSDAERRQLGLDRPIARRDFIKGLMAGAGALLIPGCSSRDTGTTAGAPAFFGGDTEGSFSNCHRVGFGERIGNNAADTGETYDVVIVGAGLGGLTAAYFFNQNRPDASILLLDNHADFGGDAQRNEMTIKGQKIIAAQGCDFQWDIDPDYGAAARLWSDLGIDLSPTSDLAFAPEAYRDHVFIDGEWILDFWETGYQGAGSPWSKQVQDDYDALFEILDNFEWEPWGQVQAELAELDKISFKAWMEVVNGWDPQLTHLMDMWIRSDYGTGADTLSAACGIWNYSGGDYTMYKWPGGMSGFARHLVNALIPGALDGRDIITGDLDYGALDLPGNQIRIRLRSTVVEVGHESSANNSDHVLVSFLTGDDLHQLKAKSVIMAGGGYMTKRIVTDLPQEQRDAYDKFHYSAYTVANVWVNNSRALDELDYGYSGGIWSPRIANYITVVDGMTEAGNDPNRDPERPNCMTMWCPQLPDPELDGDYAEQCNRARAEMLDRSFEDYEVLIRQELLDVFGDAGFDPAEDIEGIAVNRWGHAEIVCYPGFAFVTGSSDESVPGVPTYDARQPFGRIAFAHTDLNGFADNQGTTMVSRRAVDDLLGRVRY